METENKKNIEEVFKKDLHQYLVSINRVDEHLPEAPDIEALWAKIGESYMPDALREFNKYPTVALGWIMFVGMAIAKYWDEDWELYSKVEDLYKYLRDRIDFDHMDDYICEKVLLLKEDEHKATAVLRELTTPSSTKDSSLAPRRLSVGSSQPSTKCISWGQPSN